MSTLDGQGAAAAALRYAAAGWPVLALYEVRDDGACACGRVGCDRAGKHPRTSHGHLGASTEPGAVARWWRRWPGANVGAATGHVFDVWDIDLPAGPAGAIIGAHGAGSLPAARTGGGGTHVLVAPCGHGCRTGFLPGCDWRGGGGYVVLPPSRHVTGGRYRWLSAPAARGGFAPAPASLLTALAPPARRATRRAWPASVGGGYAAAALRAECARVAAAPLGGRNHALNRAAFNLGQLVATGDLDPAAAAAGLAAAAGRCGLGAREAARTIASGLAAGQRTPRTARLGGPRTPAGAR